MLLASLATFLPSVVTFPDNFEAALILQDAILLLEWSLMCRKTQHITQAIFGPQFFSPLNFLAKREIPRNNPFFHATVF